LGVLWVGNGWLLGRKHDDASGEKNKT